MEQLPALTTIQGARRWMCERLSPLTGPDEARWMARVALESVTGKSQVDLLIDADKPLGEFRRERIAAIVERLLRHEPLQYILGEARFHGMDLKVTPATLIPRPETEQLVDIITDDADGRADLAVLDVGTGSGAIAIALSRTLRFARVEGVDISEQALEVARENARALRARVEFDVCDILRSAPPATPYDIIVSNPPYIAPDERADMEPRVLDYEPHTALFVPQDDPLLFYRAIARGATDGWLKPGGRLYFEINPRFYGELKRMMLSLGLQDVEILADMYRRNRFLRCRL